MKNNFNNANEAFTYFYKKIRKKGVSFGDTKALFNVGFTIKNPSENIIIHKERNFNIEYAEAEWKWYLSGDNNVFTRIFNSKTYIKQSFSIAEIYTIKQDFRK